MVKINKDGRTSVMIRIPAHIAKQYGWQIGDNLTDRFNDEINWHEYKAVAPDGTEKPGMMHPDFKRKKA